MVPENLKARLQKHLEWVRRQFDEDMTAGFAGVPLPDSLARKYPNAPREWGLAMGVSGMEAVVRDGEAGLWRYHLLPENLQRAMKAAVTRMASRLPYGPYIATAAVIWVLADASCSRRCSKEDCLTDSHHVIQTVHSIRT
jgi:hypothetical protein